jgi:hypothetical protein
VSPLTIARVGVGVASIGELFPMLTVLNRFEEPGILRLPIAGFPYPGETAAMVLAVVWASAALGLAIGFAGGGFVLASCIGYVVLLDQQTYSNHNFLLAILSVLLGLSTMRRHRDTAVLGLKAQLTLVYFFAAASKINFAFLSGVTIAGSLRPEFALLRTPWILVPLACAAVATELFVADAIWQPKWRRAAVIAGVGLHVCCVVIMDSTRALSMFAIACMSLYPLFWLGDERIATFEHPQSGALGVTRAARRLPLRFG